MPQLGIDYAGGRPGGAAISAAGYAFCVRYLTAGGPGLPGKLLTPGEFADLQAHGISVVLNWETTADRMLGGYAVGVADAGEALITARTLGVPDNRPIFFSADWDATLAQQTQIDAYLQGCAAVIGIARVGIYGGYWPVKRALDSGTARWAWQTGAWSGGNRDPRIHLYQRVGTVTVGGIPCDVNEACQLPDFGQHPSPTSPAEEDDMQNYPITGKGRMVLDCPTGSAAANDRKAWLSATLLDPTDGNAWVQVYAQGDARGVNSWRWAGTDLKAAADNNLARPWKELTDGTTKLVISWDLTTSPGGTLCLETQPQR